MKLLLSYLKDKRRLFFGVFLAAFLFGLVFFLCELPLFPYLYGMSLCLFVGLAALCLDYLRFRWKHHALCLMLRETSCDMALLPQADGLIESDYQALLQQMNTLLKSHRQEAEQSARSAMDYYTLWVHQIKTPIAAMKLLLEADTRENRALREELFRIEQYTEMVLCYLRLEGTETDYVIQEYDLDGILCQALRKFGPQFIRKKLTLRYVPTEAKILTDEKWFLFVVEQVLSNAVKYTKEGSITIGLVCPGILSIRDTGLGIAPEDLPRIFERGYTGANGRLDKNATGLGLYLCRRILNRLGHTISARSEIGAGTEVLLDFSRENLQVE